VPSSADHETLFLAYTSGLLCTRILSGEYAFLAVISVPPLACTNGLRLTIFAPSFKSRNINERDSFVEAEKT
jgi:hypothetical protein